LRCYPGETRPDSYVTVPKFAAATGSAILARRESPDHAERWEAESLGMRHALERDVLGGFPKRGELKVALTPVAASKNPEDGGAALLSFEPEAGLPLTASVAVAKDATRLAVVLDCDRGLSAVFDPLAKSLGKAGWGVVAPELRGTGQAAVKGDTIGRAPDHNSAEWSMWLGRPLLGQWTWDVIRLLDALDETKTAPGKPVTLIGIGPAGVVALCAAALDKRVAQVVCVKTLASYVTDEPYVGQRMGILAPHILKKVGDVQHLAALVAPRPVIFAGGVTGGGAALPQEKLAKQFAWASDVYGLLKASNKLQVTEDAAADKLAKRLEA